MDPDLYRQVIEAYKIRVLGMQGLEETDVIIMENSGSISRFKIMGSASSYSDFSRDWDLRITSQNPIDKSKVIYCKKCLMPKHIKCLPYCNSCLKQFFCF